MSNLLKFVLNGETRIEYNRSKPLAGLQRRFLIQMDADMDEGLMIEGEFISAPDKNQRVRYVANHIVNSFLDNKEKMIATGFAYIAKTLPELKQIRVDTISSEHSIALIFNEEEI